MTFVQRRIRLTTHFSEGIPVVSDAWLYCTLPVQLAVYR